jgi:2-(1,2-epoxy-1,2-dihydrophenyl)acetyl-CoA isomerase
MSSVHTQLAEQVLVVTIDRPERLNALDDACRAELLAALQRGVRDPDVRAVVLTGAGRAFCTGQDVTASDELVDAGATVQQTYNPLVVTIRNTGKPVIAAINGPAVGAGMGLALSCDVCVMGRSAYLSCAFGRVGLVPDTGITVVLARALGHVRAYEAATTGRRIGADEALALGLVTEVVGDEAVLARAIERGQELAAGPALAFELTKQLLVAAARRNELEVLELEAQSQGRAARTDEHREAIEAFIGRYEASARR